MNPAQQKSIALICNHSPYGGSEARELIDTALAAAAFEQKVSLIFMGAGALMLIEKQNPAAIEQKNLSRMMNMLSMYDVEDIFVHDQALKDYSLSTEELVDSAKIVDSESLQRWISQQDLCMSL